MFANRKMSRGVVSAITLCLSLATARAAIAQASFSQAFDNNGPVQAGTDGPVNLIAQGWIFRNQSAPVATGTWHTGTNSLFPSQSGAGYLSVGSESTAFLGGDVSQWAILPAIANQKAGDRLTFFVRRVDSSNVDTLQVRYAPGGGTSTGSGGAAVGDFTTLLADLNPVQLTGWTVVSVTVPGTGRLALRNFVDNACNFGCFASYLGIDALTVNQSPPPGPPMPVAGQTVHWTSALSPVVLASDTAVVSGGTLIVDGGVSVQVKTGATLYVPGTLRFEAGSALDVAATGNVRVEGLGEFLGSAASPVALTGGAGGPFGKGIEVAPGATVRLDHVVSDLPVFVNNQDVIYGTQTKTISIDHSTFSGDGDIFIASGTLVIRNTTVTGPSISAQDSYVLVDGLNLNGTVLKSTRYKAGQPLFIDHVSAHNVAGDAPFVLSGFDHFFGANNTIANNLYPVHLTGGGIAPGSTLPTGGNANNYVHGGLGNVHGRVTFANAGLPYRIDADTSGDVNEGELTIEPGVTLKLGPDAKIHSYAGGTVIAEGLPDAPITFERLNPGQAWQTISFRSSRRPKLENCIARGGLRAFGADETVVRLESCLLEGNAIGANSYSFGNIVARSCAFLGNASGVQTSAGLPATGGFAAGHADLDGLTNPNTFAANGIAFEVLAPLNIESGKYNWWNAPSGPMAASNPGGTGELVTGNAVIVPFLTSAPNANNHAPIVRLHEHSFLLEEGRKLLLTWDAQDDDGIAGFRVLYSPHSENPALALLLDGIPAGARSVEITVPQAPPSSNNGASVLRVVATDAAGQEGWDEIQFNTPYVDFGNKGVLPQPIAGTLRPGQNVDLCWTVLPGSSGLVDAFLFLDSDEQLFSLGGASTAITCMPLGLKAPGVSTDTARVGLRYSAGAGGRDRWEFTPEFSIRPDPALLGDAPPVVQLTSPQAGQSFAGGSTVPVLWSASDDEALRSFAIHASYDNGRTWQVVADNLPAAASSYAWILPGSSGIESVRVRVIARDLRFQNTSSTSGAFAVTPGAQTWTQLGGGVAGAGGLPVLVGEGSLAANAPVQLQLSSAAARAPTSLIIGLSALNAPFKGGVLVPNPDLVLSGIGTDASGSWLLVGTWPAGLPAGTQAWFQTWISDASAPFGLAASGGLRALVP